MTDWNAFLTTLGVLLALSIAGPVLLGLISWMMSKDG